MKEEEENDDVEPWVWLGKMDMKIFEGSGGRWWGTETESEAESRGVSLRL